jgi:hypothetical protein
MDVLAGRKTGGVVGGEVRVNGFPKVQKTFARVAGYVEQEDGGLGGGGGTGAVLAAVWVVPCVAWHAVDIQQGRAWQAC